MGGWVCGWLGMSIEIGQVIITACADVIQRPGWHQVFCTSVQKLINSLCVLHNWSKQCIVCAPLGVVAIHMESL